MRRYDQLTLRGLGPRVQREVRALAKRERISLNRAALRLLEKGAGVGKAEDSDRIGAALDSLIGTWTKKEADEMLDSIQSCEQIDPEVWD